MSAKQKLKQEKEKNVQVFVRVRPINNAEKAARSYTAVTCNGSKEIVVKERPTDKLTKTFKFDKVFGPESKQIDVYKTVVHPLIDEVLAGYNCTVFAYGQTGTGKTFTMEGEKSNDPAISWEEDPLSGIIPRSLSQLYDELRLLQAEYTVRVSFLELYNEEIFDLLSAPDDTTKLRLFEDNTRKGSVIIQGLEEVPVQNKQEVYKILEKGSLKRTTAATLMNAQSSRSHTIFSITVHIKDNSIEGEELLKTGKLNLVDLAGSENISRSGAVDKRAREAGNINQSLLTLGRCITSLVEHCPHIPYRESKLTRLLQESLGGRTKTSIIATVSPAVSNLEETLSTLDYAHRAKNITNKPEINQKVSKNALMKQYDEELKRMKLDLEAARQKNGVFIAQENYTEMLTKIELQEEEIMNKISALKVVKEEMDKKEELCNSLNMKLNKAKDVIHKTIADREEKNFLIEKYMENEQKLTEQARQLTEAVTESTKDAEKLHQKLDTKKKIEESNALAANLFFRNFQNKNVELNNMINEFHQGANFFIDQKNSLNANCEMQTNYMESARSSLSNLNSTLQKLDDIFKNSECKIIDIQDSHSNHREAEIDFIENTETNVTNIIETFKTHFKILSDNISALEESQVQFNDNLQANANSLESLVHQSANLKLHFEDLQNTINQIAETLAGKIETIKSLEESMHEAQRQKDDNIICKMSSFQDMFESLVQQMENLKDAVAENATAEQRKTLQQTIDETAADVENVNNATEIIANLRSQHDDNCNKILSLNENLKDDIKENSNKLSKYANNYRKANEKDRKTLDDITNKQKRTLDSYKNVASSYHEDQYCKFKKYNLDMNSSAVVLRNEFTEQIDQVKLNVNQCSENLNQFTRAKCEEFKDQFTRVNKQVGDFSNTVASQADLIDSFINRELQRDRPTGQTPERRNWQYPKQLACMSPHERLLQRFWKERPVIVYDNFDSDPEDVNGNTDKHSEEGDKTSEEDDSSQMSSSDDSSINVRKCASTDDILAGLNNTMDNSNLSDCCLSESMSKNKKSRNEIKQKNKPLFKKPARR